MRPAKGTSTPPMAALPFAPAGADQTVGIAERDDRKNGRTPGGECRAVADRFAGIELAGAEAPASRQDYDRDDRDWGAREPDCRRRAPFPAAPGRKDNRGRARCRPTPQGSRARAASGRKRRAEALELAPIQCVFRLVGAREMAHDQREIDAGERIATRSPTDRRARSLDSPERFMPVSIWMAASRIVLRALAACDHSAISSSAFSTGVSRCATRAGALPRSDPVEDEDARIGQKRAQCHPLLHPRDKERSRRPLRRERLGDRRHAEAIGIRLDDRCHQRAPPPGAAPADSSPQASPRRTVNCARVAGSDVRFAFALRSWQERTTERPRLVKWQGPVALSGAASSGTRPHMSVILPAVLPVFIIALIGYALAKADRPFDNKTIAFLVASIGTPALVFFNLAKTTDRAERVLPRSPRRRSSPSRSTSWSAPSRFKAHAV